MLQNEVNEAMAKQKGDCQIDLEFHHVLAEAFRNPSHHNAF